MMRFELVKQRGPGDCGIAALAMFVRCNYEDALGCFKTFDHSIGGITDGQLMGAIAYNFGIKVNRADGFCDSVPGILTVPSLTTPGRLHYVFWTGKRVLDPQFGSSKHIYETYEDCLYGVVFQIYSIDVAAEEALA